MGVIRTVRKHDCGNFSLDEHHVIAATAVGSCAKIKCRKTSPRRADVHSVNHLRHIFDYIVYHRWQRVRGAGQDEFGVKQLKIFANHIEIHVRQKFTA